ncbi:MAG: hypothetical protein HOK21_12195 [Rhodospirillaceae bacterium]|nr:hypothetical protein [Rhodospirillaceae bacterium]MBT5524843.1 hypothetical protein [Rhodospirillaceae bacterium]MBT5881116.1 hypothetical protein [Rhodospirillaceae bacterium]
MAKESDLYAPVKAMLEGKGYQVKGEVNGCDVVAVKDGAPAVIVELKLAFSLDLVLQGIQRQSLADDVYLAINAPDTPQKRKNWRSRQRGYVKLCRMLGLGLMLVQGSTTKILLDPTPYVPRKNKRRQTRLMNEFMARVGDPNMGGINRTKIITAYRQDALRCAVVLSGCDSMKVAEIKAAAGVPKAASILQKNYYNWFARTARGIYCLTPTGQQGLKTYAEALPALNENPAAQV